MYEQEKIKPYGEQGGKSSQVRLMFDRIAHSYDKLNHTLSAGVDKLWRRQTIKALAASSPEMSHILDVATGTGDMAILAARQFPSAHVTGIDISDGMMAIGRQKLEKEGLNDKVELRNADCSALPFSSSTFDAIISAFGLRNFANLDTCLEEMHRVLADDGHVAIADLCSPTSFPMRQLFWVYQRVVMPLIGRLISHDNKAYTYLPETMRAIPQGEKMKSIFEKAGFHNVAYRRLPFGMCMLYTATK
jgi:demethylmenaquinone methyltransferase/2-methoxy-6-polyprenyl-1,4-benzoquinol methylase